MNCTEDSQVCKQLLVVVLLLLRAAEAALIPHEGLAVASIERLSTTRQEKVSLQSRNRVISGFTIDKEWNEETL